MRWATPVDRNRNRCDRGCDQSVLVDACFFDGSCDRYHPASKIQCHIDDTVIGIVMSFTIALGIVILSRGGGFNKYSRFLIGDLLSITPGEIYALAVLAIAFIVLWIISVQSYFLVSTNTSLARSRE